VSGDVLFEKVGWGRWDARMRGQPPREGRTGQSVPGSIPEGSHLAISPPASYSGSYALSSADGLQIPGTKHNWREAFSGTRWAGDSVISSRDEETEDMNMAEHEADKMSLDGASSCAPEDVPMTDDPDDVTDEEDWARIGPEALRKPSAPYRSSAGGHRPNRINYNYLSISATSRMKPTPSLLSAKGIRSDKHARRHGKARVGNAAFTLSGFSFDSHGVQEAQEREAVEALLRMGSM